MEQEQNQNKENKNAHRHAQHVHVHAHVNVNVNGRHNRWCKGEGHGRGGSKGVAGRGIGEEVGGGGLYSQYPQTRSKAERIVREMDKTHSIADSIRYMFMKVHIGLSTHIST